jgi:hypothetical protein
MPCRFIGSVTTKVPPAPTLNVEPATEHCGKRRVDDCASVGLVRRSGCTGHASLPSHFGTLPSGVPSKSLLVSIDTSPDGGRHSISRSAVKTPCWRAVEMSVAQVGSTPRSSGRMFLPNELSMPLSPSGYGSLGAAPELSAQRFVEAAVETRPSRLNP